MNCGRISNAQHSSVLVILPLDALILTMRKGTLNACVLKGDRLNGDLDDDREEVKLNAPVGSLLSTTYDPIFTHPEVVVHSGFATICFSWTSFKPSCKSLQVAAFLDC